MFDYTSFFPFSPVAAHFQVTEKPLIRREEGRREEDGGRKQATETGIRKKHCLTALQIPQSPGYRAAFLKTNVPDNRQPLTGEDQAMGLVSSPAHLMSIRE